ncbi:MAG: YscO family type III secretion system apparatus protein [Alphaproteobacteria bacterium GM7ARS4]|nr:YscO family type III secretion system apparatus protein [Alphaproteobacteria bacterium GM7ARS4]
MALWRLCIVALLRTLLSLRERRLMKAQAALRKAQHAHDRAVQHWLKCREALLLWRRALPEKENKLFLQLQDKDDVKRSDVEAMRIDIGNLRAHENRLDEESRQADHERKKTQTDLLACQETYQQAQKDMEKLKEADRDLSKRERLWAERMEDDVVDELSTSRHIARSSRRFS